MAKTEIPPIAIDLDGGTDIGAAIVDADLFLIDDGAAMALLSKKRSLLPAGIQGIDGEFKRGDVVYVISLDGKRLACGISNYDSQDIVRIKGGPSKQIVKILGYQYGQEVVHRNNMVLL